MNYEVNPEEEKLRAKISEIIVKWDMLTRQVAITEIIQACGMYGFLAGQREMREECLKIVDNSRTVDETFGIGQKEQQARSQVHADILIHSDRLLASLTSKE